MTIRSKYTLLYALFLSLASFLHSAERSNQTEVELYSCVFISDSITADQAAPFLTFTHGVPRTAVRLQDPDNPAVYPKGDGFRGQWYELTSSNFTYGRKYSGGLGTYTRYSAGRGAWGVGRGAWGVGRGAWGVGK